MPTMPQLVRKREWHVKEERPEKTVYALMEKQNGQWVELGAIPGNESFHDEYYNIEYKTEGPSDTVVIDPSRELPVTLDVKFDPEVHVQFEPTVKVEPTLHFEPAVTFNLSNAVVATAALVVFFLMFLAALLAVVIVR